MDTKGVCVNVKGRRWGWAGTAYHGIPEESNAPPSADYLVTLRLAPPEVLKLPCTGQSTKRSAPYCMFTWQEILVYLAAHEFKHVEQFKEHLSRSEVRCNAYATHVLKLYREQGRVLA